VTHILTVTLTDEECHALHDLLLTTVAVSEALASARREVLYKIEEVIDTPHLF
jgi:hypothetical protein